MNTSLSHLPEKNQFEINHITEIIRDVIDPEMIILFGSYAKGKQVNHRYNGRDGILYEYISDYDFLVVVNKVTKETSDQEWIIEERAEQYEPPVNIEIHETEFINYGLERGQYFFSDIVKEGILLFDKGTVTFAEARELTPEEQKEIDKEYFDTWYTRGQEFLLDTKNAIDRGSFKIAAFYLHQATENFLNTILLVFTGYKPRTHNIKKLRRKAKQFSEDLYLVFAIETNKYEKQLFDLLKDGYIDARYKKSYKITENQVKEIYNKVQLMESIVREVVNKKIDSI